MTFADLFTDLFTQPTVSLYRECTGRERTDRLWWKRFKELAQEAAIVGTALILTYTAFTVFG